GELTADMAHELNKPLMAVYGGSQLCSILIKDIKDEKLKKNLQIIFEQTQKAKDIIQRVLTFSKPNKGQTKELDINDTVDFIAQLVEDQYSLANIKIIRNYTPNLPRVTIDQRQISEVFMNLIRNASEAMPKGGSIAISTSRQEDNIYIDFKDAGTGMSEEILQQIFNPFFTTKKLGAGLGLSVCYGVIKAHGGELKYKSKLDEGTTATVVLPVGGQK
ncbi:MAG: ATP-binding protein, partial [Candidatus Omnitrophota bacterium]